MVVLSFSDQFLQIKVSVFIKKGIIDGLGGNGPWARFLVHRVDKFHIKLQNIGDSKHWLRINENKLLDGFGSGGQYCIFKIIRHGKGVVSLESAVYPGCHVGILPNGGVTAPYSTFLGPYSQFFVKVIQ